MKQFTFIMLFLTGCVGAEPQLGSSNDAGIDSSIFNPFSSISGSSGKDGRDGLNGAPGVNGKDGLAYSISKIWRCEASVPNFNSCGTNLDFWYWASEMSSGDIMIRVGVDSFVIAADHGSGNNSTHMWKANSAQAGNGANWLLFDVCSNSSVVATTKEKTGNWAFSLNKLSNKLDITYNDVDVTTGSFRLQINCWNP